MGTLGARKFRIDLRFSLLSALIQGDQNSMLARVIGILPIGANFMFLLSPLLLIENGINLILAGVMLTCASLLLSLLYIYVCFTKIIFVGHAAFVVMGFGMFALNKSFEMNPMLEMLMLPFGLILLNSISVKMGHLLLDSSVSNFKVKAVIFNLTAFFMLIAVSLTPFLVGFPLLQWFVSQSH
ncbi:MAG: hypothetical protein NT027_14855 [Proteobacteria bacterium]|nr:hypothetical protein [Pseudomonadota bacterium]